MDRPQVRAKQRAMLGVKGVTPHLHPWRQLKNDGLWLHGRPAETCLHRSMHGRCRSVIMSRQSDTSLATTLTMTFQPSWRTWFWCCFKQYSLRLFSECDDGCRCCCWAAAFAVRGMLGDIVCMHAHRLVSCWQLKQECTDARAATAVCRNCGVKCDKHSE